MVRSEVDFLSQIFYGKECEMKTEVSKLGRSSMHIYQELYQEGRLCARSTVVTVFFDYQVQKSMEIPSEVRTELEKLLV